MPDNPYRFRSMTSADLPLVRRWLAEPHVVQWWGDPSEQYDLVSGDLDEPAMDQFIVSAEGGDFAYLQCYDLTAWNSGFGEHPRGTRGVIAGFTPSTALKRRMSDRRAINLSTSWRLAGLSST